MNEAKREGAARVRTTTTRVHVSSSRGVFMISVAAELADMHPQTLRMYEARGLIEPKRSPKGTRLYSQEDVERLRRIQEMTAELGMNLAGVERVFELEEQLESMGRKVAALERRANELKAEVQRLESLRRELRAEIVPYPRGGEIVRRSDVQRFKVPVERNFRALRELRESWGLALPFNQRMEIHVRTDVDRGEEGEAQAAALTVSRAGLLSRLAAGLGAVSLGGAAAAGLATATGAQSGSSSDRAVLQFALTLEHLQATFYAEALRAGKLSGEPRQFAQTVGAEERAHVGYLSQAIGPGAAKAQQFQFGDALSDQASFIATAVMLEETGLAAYNGQAANLSPDALARVGRVISVEARHAAWARALAGEQPAPVAIDVPINASQAQKALRRFTA